ncbi:MAG: hypothetical protein KGM24_07350, partial [Elusimicrobia bacterium]|nr:hypothetical protein [Elusimicrobiota bacterium]
ASWDAFVAAVSKERITLGAALESASREDLPGGGWRVRFSKTFDLETAQRAKELLDGTLAGLAGRPLPLELAAGGAAPSGPIEIVDPSVPETPGGAPEGSRWKDVVEDGGGTAGGAGALKKAEGVFGGKARIVKKPQ